MDEGMGGREEDRETHRLRVEREPGRHKREAEAERRRERSQLKRVV